MSAQDLTGQTFGHLTVLRRAPAPEKNKKPDTFWWCLCSCGVEKAVRAYPLKSGRSSSCGHIRRGSGHPMWRGVGEMGAKTWARINNGAASRGIKVDITMEQAWDLFLRQGRSCALSGQLLTMGTASRRGDASLDRIDSSLGYTAGNVQWVHKSVNIAKNTLSQDEFINLCKLVAQHN